MRQLANQTVGRAEKTEVLSEDLLQVEKRRELVKQVSHSTHKKLTGCLQGQQGVDVDKRSKKLPLTSLAQCLVEGAVILGDDSLLGKMLKICGETQDRLAQELLLFELQIERDVVEPLYTLSEVEIPNIQKQRKHLAKLVLDMDSARTRWQQSSKSSTLTNKDTPTGAKADALREEMEEAAIRMEICRDQLSADMYSFMAKEIDNANYFQTLIEVQAEYHRKSLELLQNVLPQIKAQQESWVEKPCYGKPLEEHLTLSGREIAFPIEACVTMLLDCGLQEEVNMHGQQHLTRAVSSHLDLNEYQDYNKMTPGNIAIVLGPNLLWAHTEGNITEMMTTVSLQIVGIIEPIIQHADWFFPEEIEFNVTGNYGSPVHTNHNANYSSMPSPDLDQSDRRQQDQSRRPLSVATDNMMLEFYKKDGCVCFIRSYASPSRWLMTPPPPHRLRLPSAAIGPGKPRRPIGIKHTRADLVSVQSDEDIMNINVICDPEHKSSH
uniref:Rho GTPase activating protein 44 n=1 Tax=Cyprinus carpio TaxID=7962 RepID=A0A8C2EFN0_CYPCA